MVKESFSSEFDQHDPKVFKESLGSFGTTTNPMAANQLAELQTRIRQGVKHVEIHLANSGKGQFNVNETPDKYGFEQRRTIMQLAKLNKQTLSVHGTFAINSFSGLGGNGFNEVQRANNLKEIDETLKFAAETAKGGAVVFHLHETGLPPTNPGEVNLPDWYLKKLKEEKPQEYESLMKNYLNKDDLSRQFVDNPDLESELKVQYDNLSDFQKQELKKNFGVDNWKEYHEYNRNEQIKLEQEGTPLVVVGNSITRASRQQDVVSLEGLKNLSEKEKQFLTAHGITTDYDNKNIDDFQRIMATFTNGVPTDLSGLTSDEYKKLRSKFVTEYKDVLKSNHGMKSKADKEYFQKSMDMQIQAAKLQKEDLSMNRKRYSQYIDEIEEIKVTERRLMKELDNATRDGDKKKEKEILTKLNGGLTEDQTKEMEEIVARAEAAGGRLLPQDVQRYQELQKQTGGLKRRKYELEVGEIGQLEYQKLDRYDEMMSQFNEQIKKANEQKQNAKVMTDEIFEKNASAMGHLGLKALKYQLDLKQKSRQAESKLKEFNSKISTLEDQYNRATDEEEKDRLNNEIQKVKYDRRLWVGVKDYEDIDIKDRPLYLAPENIMAGYGYMDSLEEYKAVIRTSWDEFAKKLMSNEGDYKAVREAYEKETGEKIDSLEKAKEVAKQHIGGTFDNAHAGVWLKYFKRNPGESEEHRIERFNKWLNQEAENMAREGIIKHVHFNDTQAKDDDHNLLGQGLLDIHDLRDRLRKAGIKEALIVEPGGRNGGGGAGVEHMMNAFDIFNPTMKEQGYRIEKPADVGTAVSDWMSVKRNYNTRPQYSQYGMSYNTFRNTPNQNPDDRGGWSGTNFL